MFRCLNGHEWEAPEGADEVSCPVCGQVHTLGTPPTFPEARPELAISSDRANPPPVVEGYEVLEELGRGGMGVVYKARKAETGEVVALKVIRKERLGSADFLARFRREVLASSRLAHPNLVQVFEADLTGEQPFLAVEYVPGLTLQDLVDRQGALTPALACDVVRQIALALKHADEQRLVHRDIKPSNIMVLAPGGLPLPPRPAVKVLDMGVARLFQGEENETSLTTLTRDGSVIGTPDYIAPEQLENPRGVDVRADLYSLGCVFYFLLTGQVPFPGGTLVQKLDRQRWQAAPSVTQLRPDLPAGVAAVVRRLMAKHPDDRYQTPAELISVLEEMTRPGALPGQAHLEEIRPLREMTGHKGAVTSLAWAGEKLVSAGGDRTIRAWSPTGQELCRLGEGKQDIGCLAASSGIVYAGLGVTVRGIELATGREAARLVGHSDAVRCLAISPDGKHALSGSDDRIVRVWDLERGKAVTRFARHTAGVAAVALAPDGKLAASGGRDQTIRIWEAFTGKEVRQLTAPRGPVMCLAWSADGRSLFSGHFDTTLRMWDMTTGREARRFSGHRQMVSSLTLVGAYLVSASHDQTVRVWDVAAGAEVAQCVGHSGAVAAAVAGPAGEVATAGQDGTVRVWKVLGQGSLAGKQAHQKVSREE
jgi:tRNA A-37 threonylcarbamoyl transferase component Bud32